MFCGYLLAHLGAHVVAVEPPDGSSVRSRLPRANGQGLWWEAYARGKDSLILDLETDESRARLRELVAEVDVLVESYPRETAERYGVTYDALAEINPALIVVSISPFGRTGPKADWPATDLTVWAACGAQVLAGDDDRAPVRTSVPQAFLHAGADAAGAALIALQARHKTGLGQHIDVSAQQSSAQAALSANLAEPNNGGVTVMRAAGGLAGILPVKLTWPCRDGYVAVTLLFGAAFTEPNRRLLRWVHECGHCTKDDAEADWGERITEMALNDEDPEPYFELCRKIEAFTLERTQAELFEEGLERGIYIAPTLDVAGLFHEKQFIERGFWQDVEGERVPGAFAKFSATPIEVANPAPRADAFGGFEPRSGSPAASESDGGDLPLAGLKVLDFMWVIAGPFFTRVLADYGATVIKVESTTRMEPARAAPTFKDGEQTLEHGVPFANFNAGKMGVTIDPSNPVGREVILDLVRWADVVTESFSPKAMKGWGLDYASLKAVNPDLIMLSSCLMGQTGPRSQVPGYGNMAAAITGFYELTGWPDRSPAGPYLAYTDGVSPRFMLVSLLAALEHKRKTGEGQHIDISQAEAAIHMLGPALADYERNGHVWPRMGNRDLEMCPHGVFPSAGDDAWIAIACQTDADWQALSGLMGLADDPAFASVDARRQREDEIEEMIGRWTSQHDAFDLQGRLVSAGVAAHAMQNSAECYADPQLRHREHFVPVQHSTVGEMIVEGTRFKLSRTPARIERASPALGEHNAEVLLDVLNYDGDRVADVFAALAME
jgi:crotonobetainyl-CoA:carnitine CoA-transferase CaiB-like acyl-CoA transferase